MNIYIEKSKIGWHFPKLFTYANQYHQELCISWRKQKSAMGLVGKGQPLSTIRGHECT